MIYNVYQNLLKVPPGATVPVPDAAQSCDFTGNTTYACTMKPSLKFSNGDALDAAAVVYSFRRMVKINDPNGPAVLIGAMKKIEVQGDKVVFTLNQHDNTWPYVLTTLATAIVDPKVFPAKARLADSKVIGSGPYKIESYQPSQQLVLAKNTNYTGDDQLQNSRFILKYEQSASTLKLDVEQGTVDVAFQGLSPTDITSLQGETSRGLRVVHRRNAGPGRPPRRKPGNRRRDDTVSIPTTTTISSAVGTVSDRAGAGKGLIPKPPVPPVPPLPPLPPVPPLPKPPLPPLPIK